MQPSDPRLILWIARQMKTLPACPICMGSIWSTLPTPVTASLTQSDSGPLAHILIGSVVHFTCLGCGHIALTPAPTFA